MPAVQGGETERKHDIMHQIHAIGERHSSLFADYPGMEAGRALAESNRLLFAMARLVRESAGIDATEWTSYVKSHNVE